MDRLLKRPRRIALVALPISVGLMLTAVVMSKASTSPGCDAVASPIVESTDFTPAELMRSLPADPPINPTGTSPATVPADALVTAIQDLPLSWAATTQSGAVYQYFLAGNIDPTLTVSNFYAAGGIQLDRDPIDNGQAFASTLLTTLGERAVEIEVGDYKAALVWADPLINGIRAHHLYWSDNAYNYTLIADVSAERIVTLGRELVCAGPLSG